MDSGPTRSWCSVPTGRPVILWANLVSAHLWIAHTEHIPSAALSRHCWPPEFLVVTLYSVGHQGREAQEAEPATHELALRKLYSCIPTVGWPGLSQQGMPFGSSPGSCFRTSQSRQNTRTSIWPLGGVTACVTDSGAGRPQVKLIPVLVVCGCVWDNRTAVGLFLPGTCSQSVPTGISSVTPVLTCTFHLLSRAHNIWSLGLEWTLTKVTPASWKQEGTDLREGQEV